VVVVTTTHRLNAFAYLWLAGLPGTGGRFASCANLGLRDLTLMTAIYEAARSGKTLRV